MILSFPILGENNMVDLEKLILALDASSYFWNMYFRIEYSCLNAFKKHKVVVRE